MKVVATYDNSFAAELAKGSLESAGINAYVQNDHISMIAGIYNNDLLSIQLTVDDADYEAAKKILETPVKPEE